MKNEEKNIDKKEYVEFKRFQRTKGTFSVAFRNLKKMRVNTYFLQFSLVDPWFKPGYKKRDNNGSWIAGIVPVYVGKIVSTKKAERVES